jgi:hypothetical protein
MTVKDFELARSDPPRSIDQDKRRGSSRIYLCKTHGEAQNVHDAMTAFSRGGAKRAAPSRPGRPASGGHKVHEDTKQVRLCGPDLRQVSNAPGLRRLSAASCPHNSTCGLCPPGRISGSGIISGRSGVPFFQSVRA